MTKTIDILIVEGKDDESFFKAFCDYIKVANFKIVVANNGQGASGKQVLIQNLKAIIQADKTQANIGKVLLVCDADYSNSEDIYGGFEKTKNALEKSILEIKGEINYKNKDLKFFIIPNNKDDGNLETLFLSSIIENFKSSLECVEDYLKCVSQKNSDLKKIKNDKTKALSLLSSIACGDAVRGVGRASKYWSFESEKLLPLKTFLTRNLFSEQDANVVDL